MGTIQQIDKSVVGDLSRILQLYGGMDDEGNIEGETEDLFVALGYSLEGKIADVQIIEQGDPELMTQAEEEIRKVLGVLGFSSEQTATSAVQQMIQAVSIHLSGGIVRVEVGAGEAEVEQKQFKGRVANLIQLLTSGRADRRQSLLLFS